MPIGVRNSYATTEAPQDNIMQAMQYVDQLDYRAKQDKAAQAQAKAKAQAEKEKELQDYQKQFNVNITGNQSIDDLVIPYASQVRDKGADLTRKIQSTTDPIEKNDLMKQRARLEQSFSIVKQTPDLLIKQAEEIAKGVKEGKYNSRDVDAIQKTLGQLETGQAHLYVDEFGTPRATIFETDESGNVIGVLEKDLSIPELIKSATPYLDSNYDKKGGIAEQFTSQVGLDLKEIQTGYTTITEKQITDRVKNAAKQKAKEVSTIDDEVFEIWNRMGKEPKRKFTQEDRDEVAKYVEQDLMNRYETEYKKDVDQSGLLSAQKYRDEKEEKQTQNYNVVETPPIYTESGVKPMKGYKTVSVTNTNQKPVPSIVGYKNGKKQVHNLVTLSSYTVEEAGGVRTITAEINVPQIKTSTLTPAQQDLLFKIEQGQPVSAQEQMEVSKITKGAEFKKEIVKLTEADAVKFIPALKDKNITDANGMKNLAKTNEVESKTTEAEDLGI